LTDSLACHLCADQQLD